MTDAEINKMIQHMQEVAEVHLDACYADMWEQDQLGEGEEGEEFFPEGEIQQAGPFCGCNTCVVREVLHASYETLIKAAEHEVNTSGGV